MVYPCLLAFTVGLVALGYTNGSIMMIISGGLIGIGYGSVTPVFQTQIISSVEPHKIGIANSLFSMRWMQEWQSARLSWG